MILSTGALIDFIESIMVERIVCGITVLGAGVGKLDKRVLWGEI